MAPGPADGPVVEHVALAPPGPEPVADLLLALGLEPSRRWPRRVFLDAAEVWVALCPVGEPAATLVLGNVSEELAGLTLDGVCVVHDAGRTRRTDGADGSEPRP